MAESFRGAHFQHPSPADNRPHVFGFNTPRGDGDSLFEVRNGPAVGSRAAWVEKSDIGGFIAGSPHSAELGNRLRFPSVYLALSAGEYDLQADFAGGGVVGTRGGAGVFFLIPSGGAVTIRGITSPLPGQVIYIGRNSASLNVVIANLHGGTAPENQILTPTGAPFIVEHFAIKTLIYDGSINLWRLLGDAGGF